MAKVEKKSKQIQEQNIKIQEQSKQIQELQKWVYAHQVSIQTALSTNKSKNDCEKSPRPTHTTTSLHPTPCHMKKKETRTHTLTG